MVFYFSGKQRTTYFTFFIIHSNHSFSYQPMTILLTAKQFSWFFQALHIGHLFREYAKKRTSFLLITYFVCMINKYFTFLHLVLALPLKSYEQLKVACSKEIEIYLFKILGKGNKQIFLRIGGLLPFHSIIILQNICL